MNIKNSLRNICKKSKFFSRNYDKLTWFKSYISFCTVKDEKFAKRKYRKEIGKSLDVENPKTFDEKLWYLKLHNRDPLLTTCSDKFEVRKYVEECGFEDILNELYAVYDNAKEIDFKAFKQPVFFKCNHCSGANVIYYPDKPFDKSDFIKRFNFILKQNYCWKSREWNYKNIKTKILAEKVLRDKNGNLPKDYKFLCFSGEPKILFLDLEVCNEDGCHSSVNYRNVYDMNFDPIDMTETREHKDIDTIQKPENFEYMVEIARKLSAPFRHCRVDLYNVDGKIYFGEITFYHGGGCNNIEPKEWDYQLGDWIDISGL